MRELSQRELEIAIGGYNDAGVYTDSSTITDSDIDAMAATAQTLSATDAATFGAQQAQSFGIPVGPFTVTPIFNPFSGANSIRTGFRVRARC